MIFPVPKYLKGDDIRQKGFDMRKGYVQIYTGNGKGKTTAALGLALRAAGAGKSVFIAQFLKGRKCSEYRSLALLRPNIVIRLFGEKKFIMGKPGQKDIDAFRRGFNQSRKALFSGRYDMIILDEINVAVHMGLISVEDILSFIKEKPGEVELILTGRYAHPRIIKTADLVTCMREVKHYFRKGVSARKGIEM